MSREFIGAFGVGDKAPADMTDAEFDEWVEVMSEKLFGAAKSAVETDSD